LYNSIISQQVKQGLRTLVDFTARKVITNSCLPSVFKQAPCYYYYYYFAFVRFRFPPDQNSSKDISTMENCHEKCTPVSPSSRYFPCCDDGILTFICPQQTLHRVKISKAELKKAKAYFNLLLFFIESKFYTIAWGHV